MPPVGLYLDTARLGLMTPSAQRAVTDFARLTGEVGLALYGERFLFDGFTSLPQEIRDRFANLSSWFGVEAFKAALLTLVRAKPNCGCVLAGRSLHLVRMAGAALAKHCRTVLIPDLAWPSYVQAVRNMLADRGGKIVPFPARDLITKAGFSPTQLNDRLFSIFERERCDGAFFPAVSHDGIRLQADLIASVLSRRMGAKLIVVDAAQAVGQVTSQLGAECADIVIAGTHKWLRSGLPLGFAIYQPHARRVFTTRAHIDPLLALTNGVQDSLSRPPESVNTWPLFAAMAAVSELLKEENELPEKARYSNRRQLLAAFSGSRWLPAPVHREFRSAIILAHDLRPRSQHHDWRRFFHARGIELTSYGSSIRISDPGRALDSEELQLLAASLQEECSILT